MFDPAIPVPVETGREVNYKPLYFRCLLGFGRHCLRIQVNLIHVRTTIGKIQPHHVMLATN